VKTGGSSTDLWQAGDVNDSARHIRSASFEVTFRPARAVYLVDATAADQGRGGVRRAFQEASTRWGGACELIVLVGEGGAVDERDRTMVELSRADGAVNIDLQSGLAKQAADALGLPVIPLSGIDSYGNTLGTCNPGAVGELRTVDGSNGFVIANRGGKLWEAAAAGDLTEEHEQSLAPHMLSWRRPANGNDEVGRAQLWTGLQTLAERTLLYFGENWAEINPSLRPTVIWVIRDDAVRDCVEFWNLRALRPIRFGAMPMLLLPEDEVEHWVGFDNQLLAALHRPNDFEPDVVLVSRSVPAQDLPAFAARFNLAADDVVPGARPAPAGQPAMRPAPYTYTIVDDLLDWVSFKRRYGFSASVLATVYDGACALEFPSPVPFTMAGMTLLVVGGPAMAGLPRRPAIAELVKKGGIWRDNGLQITTMTQQAYRHEITVPSLAEAGQALLDEATSKWQMSDKGAVGAGLLETTDISVLRESNVFTMLRALTTPRHKLMAIELAEALGKDVVDLTEVEIGLTQRWSGRAERQFRSVTTVPAEGLKAPERLAALDRLAEVGWAERGLQIDCKVCRLHSFRPLNDQQVRGPAICPGCRSDAAYARGNTGLEIAYRLDSRIDDAMGQGIVAHLLTIAALRGRSTELHLLPGVDVWFPGETEKKELDLYGILDGKVAAGEVKQTAADFNDEQVRGDVEKTASVGADIHIMAAPGQIPPESVALAEELCAQAELELVVLQAIDLLS
jgi:hypothetical protein